MPESSIKNQKIGVKILVVMAVIDISVKTLVVEVSANTVVKTPL